MRSQPVLCPLHMYQRKWCDGECADARRKLAKIGSDLRQYWYDRRRGVSVMPMDEFRNRGLLRSPTDPPLWQAWRVA